MISDRFPPLGDAMEELFGPEMERLVEAHHPSVRTAIERLGPDPRPEGVFAVAFGEFEGALRRAAQEGKVLFRGIHVPNCAFGTDPEEEAARGGQREDIPLDYFFDYGGFDPEADRINAVSFFWPYEIGPTIVNDARGVALFTRDPEGRKHYETRPGHIPETDAMALAIDSRQERRSSYVEVHVEWVGFRTFAMTWLGGETASRVGRPRVDDRALLQAYRELFPEGHGALSWKRLKDRVVAKAREADPGFTVGDTKFRGIIKAAQGGFGT